MESLALNWLILVIIFKSLSLLVGLLIVTSFILYADRKIWAAIQLRKGPNVVGPWGLLQSFADFIKFILKEPIIPTKANKVIFLAAPLVRCILSLAIWAVIPLSANFVIADLNVGLLYVFALSSLGVYGVIMGGWASNSKYPFLAALRSGAQMISYEISFGLIVVTVLLCAGSLNLSNIVIAQQSTGISEFLGVPWLSVLDWYIVPLFPMFIVFFISALAETNRPPFDMLEAESELVAGFMVEYSSTPYMLFMLGEYVAILTMCALMTILFMGGWAAPIALYPFTVIPDIFWFIGKVLLMFFLVSTTKAFVPRYRYDQLMRLGWKIFLPMSLFMVILVSGVLTLIRFL